MKACLIIVHGITQILECTCIALHHMLECQVYDTFPLSDILVKSSSLSLSLNIWVQCSVTFYRGGFHNTQ